METSVEMWKKQKQKIKEKAENVTIKQNNNRRVSFCSRNYFAIEK